MYAGLSDESRRTRFFGQCAGIAIQQATRFCSPDHDHREGFVAVIELPGRADQVVGHVCIEPDGPGSAEVAVAVADALRGHGIGRRLVERAVDWARAEGLTTVTATMLAGNPRIARLLTGLGVANASRAIGAGVVEIRLDLRTGPRRP
jgi:acetyltransferase